jgi:hypothetical protein
MLVKYWQMLFMVVGCGCEVSMRARAEESRTVGTTLSYRFAFENEEEGNL